MPTFAPAQAYVVRIAAYGCAGVFAFRERRMFEHVFVTA